MTNAAPDLTIAMPAFNEVKNLRSVVAECRSSLENSGISYEILVVDDGSNDGTGQLADELASAGDVRVVHHPANLGIGAAWRTCIASSRGSWVFTQPADGQISADTARVFYEQRAESDVIIAVRRLRHASLPRRVLSATFHLLASTALRLPYREMMFCFLFRGDLVRPFRLRSAARGATTLPELLMLAHRAGARITEREADVLPRRAGEAKGARLGVVLRTGIEIVRLALVYRLWPSR